MSIGKVFISKMLFKYFTKMRFIQDFLTLQRGNKPFFEILFQRLQPQNLKDFRPYAVVST